MHRHISLTLKLSQAVCVIVFSPFASSIVIPAHQHVKRVQDKVGHSGWGNCHV